ncbi:MAG: hypothetical protein DWQ02_08095 [Bacteroidetes bacterium]|nr:MAG: hypothetical protein DWQ02_08095 [Bacteroidota bacterium]
MKEISVVLFKSKKLSNGKHPVMLRTYFDKERYIAITSAHVSEWDKKNGRFKKKYQN